MTCEVTPSYNIAPLQEVLSIINNNGNELLKLHWGLVPSWSKDKSGAAKLINARIETTAEKPSFKKPLRLQRCLIIADGFYEWKKTDTYITNFLNPVN
ncbi:MAG: SOS response-associated peptidase family protein [bacterium]